MKTSELLALIAQKTTRDDQWSSPDYLSELLLELASYYATLGPLLAEAEHYQEVAERHTKVAKAILIQDMIAEGKSATAAESTVMANESLAEDHDILLAAQYKTRRLFLARQSLDKTLDAIRSTMSYHKSEKEASRHAV